MTFRKSLLTAALIGAVALPAAAFAADSAPATAPQEPPAAARRAPFAASLQPAERTALHDAMEAARKENKPLFEKLRALHDQVSKVIAAKTFDQGAFLSLHEQIRQLRDTMDENRVKSLSTALAKLSPEDRAKMATFMSEHGPRMGMHRPHKGMMHRGTQQAPAEAPDAPAEAE